MKSKLFLAIFMILLPSNYIRAAQEELVTSEQKRHSEPSNENIAVSVIKKIRNGVSLDRDELVFINTLAISSLAFGILNGYVATSKLHLTAKESLFAAGIGAILGFIAGLPMAYFNYSEWYD